MTVYNTINKLKRRTVSELQDLKMSVLENSNRKHSIRNKGFKIIKPPKNYRNKIKLHLKNSNNIKY